MNSPAEIANWRLIVLAAALALPLFVVLNGASVTLPDSYFKVSGIPVHASALMFLLLPKRFILRPSELIILLIYLIYCVFAFLDSEARLQLTVQLGYFIYGYKILRGLSSQTIRTLDLYIAVIGSAFIFIHILSFGQAMINGDVLASGGKIFKFVIYQSHITYPIVLILILVSVNRSLGHWPILKFIILVLAMLIEIALMRRAGIGILLIFLLLFERRFLIFALLAIVVSSIFSGGFSEIVMEFFSFAERLTQLRVGDNGNFTRFRTWENSLELLNDASNVMIGNGKHNHSHNFVLHTITTHGLLISMVFFFTITYYVFLMTKKISIFNRYSILTFAIIAVDWSVNVNLYQPYYAAMFAFFLVSGTVLTREKHGK
tara:strand:- start:24418 stop:25542 length:1125 start_codon:yes stop_codon:yes gene_type:complete